MTLVSHSWLFIAFRQRQPRRRRHRKLLLQSLAPYRLCLIRRGKVAPRVLVWRGSWFDFNIHMANLERLLETWALIQQDQFVLILWMIRFFTPTSRCYVGLWPTICAIFDLLESFCFFSFLHMSYVVSIPPCIERFVLNYQAIAYGYTHRILYPLRLGPPFSNDAFSKAQSQFSAQSDIKLT